MSFMSLEPGFQVMVEDGQLVVIQDTTPASIH
jgi:hypothetical protein